MLNFIQNVADIHGKRYGETLRKIVQENIPSAFFFVGDDWAEAENAVTQLCKAGVNLLAVYVLRDDFLTCKLDSVMVLPARNVKGNPLGAKVAFLRAGFWGDCFAPLFQREGIIIQYLEDTKYGAEQYSLVMSQLPQLYQAYSLLGDEESRAVFRAAMLARVTLRNGDYRFAPEAQYFLPGFFPQKGDIVIDGGAYDGSTARDFSRLGAKVFAFEMDQANYQKCIQVAEKEHFVIENMGLGQAECDAFYQSSSVASSRCVNGTNRAHFIDIDTYVRKADLPRIDYIKLDVEGAELDTLKGAARSIGLWKPRMAISAYHKPEDLWSLITYIHSLRPDYEFAFRHYRIDVHDYMLTDMQRQLMLSYGLDLFISDACEMVLYCR